MASITLPIAVVGAGVIAGSATAASGYMASQAQKSAASKAISAQQQQWLNNQAILQPYISGGQGAFNQLQSLTGTGQGGNPLTAPLTAPFQPTMAQLSQTPGYQFTLAQGLKATQNSLAARGLGGSGEALAGAGNYATGLASTTYQNQFQNYLAQNAQIASILQNQVNTGASSANALAGVGTQLAGNIGQAQIGAGNAAAAGYGAIGSGINSLASSAQQAAMLQYLYPNGFAGGASPSGVNITGAAGTTTGGGGFMPLQTGAVNPFVTPTGQPGY